MVAGEQERYNKVWDDICLVAYGLPLHLDPEKHKKFFDAVTKSNPIDISALNEKSTDKAYRSLARCIFASFIKEVP